ncbi:MULTISPECIES: bifunctional phosphopantothenoylcysteine decarboxylase/phosphopantothenate--cysteine ligase CoaBC [unclassified Brevibacterium]|uniref:bifunctional phosphopantothenoylcysteine decarboxylase/phosphopantothenate--cysteine ligase CoaBC n=1 Tax=unclassified Brevibacterium TaxID=2614124 RepID=UPI001E3EB13F|nr:MULTISPECIES: bifunctional phosphopantothenoylcysteine decarboxylase/phosphopantothenate--cysteine ligase CoaBC [unclassified Brevibacterium]MCD1284991.1 bifunctional phosphopantothenoylcysteine decarboxylase/phosphopantothenate--cysteine ligase CoaBC [Brevibacterium sp. CCUG 69071]MDK8435386.1 bifunctional phosphopantothenoylcysteine decarboxylase/phosphopantothenate--cysteine ligase CoaBC [Brevibacterium sp. H-BE7]
MRTVLGVAGGIAAYKAAHVIRRLRELGHSVKVVPTANALEFVGAPTFEALSGQTVSTDVFDEVESVNHVRIGQEAELVIIAPATANIIAKIAAGIADDLLTATVLTTTAGVVVAPAMHTEMWHNPATVANIATLRQRGIHVLEPAVGRLTGPDSGPGRLPEPDTIVDFALAAADDESFAGRTADSGPLSGRHVAISAGGTREALDPVRYLGNRSSGKQGIALAKAAAAAGAEVELVAANVDSGLLVGLPAGITVTEIESTRQLRTAMASAQTRADALIMAAAVADYRPAETNDSKMKKSGEDGLTLTLVQNPDVLVGLVAARRPGQIIVGFAAETGDRTHSALDYAKDKFRRKGADLLVFNDVSEDRAFGHDDTVVQILSADGDEVLAGEEVRGSKDDVSQKVIDAVSRQFECVESTP